MKFKLLFSLVIVTLLLAAWADGAGSPAGAVTAAETSLDFDGKPLTFSAEPIKISGILMAPLNDLAPLAAATVTKDPKKQTFTVTNGITTLTVTAGKRTVFRNGTGFDLGAAVSYRQGMLYVPLLFFCDSFGLAWNESDGGNKLHIAKRPEPLPVLGSYANLKTMVKQAFEESRDGGGLWGRMFGRMKVQATSDTKSDSAASPAAAGSAANLDHSETNVQVQGVDEADIVKTDGEFIYQVNRDRVIIVQAVPADRMKPAGTIRLDAGTRPLQLYVDENRLVVIAQSDRHYPADEKPRPAESKAGGTRVAGPWQFGTSALVYDITDKASIRKIREVELEGQYLSSRKIGSAVYFITNKYVDVYRIMEGKDEGAQEAAVSRFRDSAVSDKYASVSYDAIRCFPESRPENYLNLAGFDLKAPERAAKIESYLGGGNSVYASTGNLYVAVGRWKPIKEETTKKAVRGAANRIGMAGVTETDVYKFKLESGSFTYMAKGTVPGALLNQFSMDEHDGYFRAATTAGDMWRTDEHTSKNNLYVLDAALKTVGKLEGMAPGERIYSARFMGKRAYMVTFRKVDPLFVIDLTDPAAPRMLGKLKIPGYSDYLHPYDENHLIGFGKDTVEMTVENGMNGSLDTMAFYQGMKIAMFDVTDPDNPKELFKELIGDRGTDSSLLHDHKTLLFDREKNLLAFPVTLAEIQEMKGKADGDVPKNMPKYGTFVNQGAYVYHVDLKDGFRLRGVISHLTKDETSKAGDIWYGGEGAVARILYIGNQLYTLSQREIRANDMASLAQTGSLMTPKE